MKTKTLLTGIALLSVTLISATATAASYCNADGADPLVCQSADGKAEVYVHPRFYDALAVSVNGFCDDGYMKINGIEVNGAADGISLPPGQAAFNNTIAVTSIDGLNVQNPLHQEEKLNVDTSISVFLTDAGLKKLGNPKFSGAYVLVFRGSHSATMYLVNNDDSISTIAMSCK